MASLMLAGNRCRFRFLAAVCSSVFHGATSLNIISTASTHTSTPPPTTKPRKRAMLPPLCDEDPINIPPPVDYPQPIELPPHRIHKPVTMIAGASRGLGLEFARQILAKYVAGPVIATCRSPDTADNLRALKDQYQSRLTIMTLDVTDEDTIKAVAQEIYNKYGRLDLYVNTVGLLHIPDVMTPERKIDHFNHDAAMLAFRTNAVGPAIVAKHMLPLLKLGQGEDSGRGGAVLVHLSAKVASTGDNKLGGWYSYRASKAGLNQCRFHIRPPSSCSSSCRVRQLRRSRAISVLRNIQQLPHLRVHTQ